VDAYTLEKLIHRIISGKQLINYENSLYELLSASMEIKLKSFIVYDEFYENNLFSDSFLLEEEIKKLLIDLEILYIDYEKDMKGLENKLENFKVELFQNYFDRTKKSSIKKQIDNIRKRYNELYSLSHSLDFLTLQNYCSNIKNEFIISNTLFFYNTKNLVFKNGIEDYNLFNNIAQTISNNILDISVLKELARSDFWRNYYTVHKNHLFPYSVIEYSEEQKAMVSISIMYDRIYEHPECPDKDIISDDDALEGWMIYHQRQNKKEKKEKGVNSMLSGKVGRSQEVFLMAGNEEQKEDILGLNSTNSNLRRQQKMSAVFSSATSVRDAELPDVKDSIRKQLSELNYKKK
jgi:hypothetical protein